MSLEILGLILLFALLTGIFIGFPIAFTLIILSVVFGYIGLGDKVFYLMVYQTVGLMKESTLAAVPLFVFMGHMMEEAGLMERLFKSFQNILGGVKGSLFLGVLFTATIFATATGIIGASVTVMGLLAAPAMMKSGYDEAMSAGVITAGGCLGILIPPSVLLVVMGPVVGVSVVSLFIAAIIPGLILRSLFRLHDHPEPDQPQFGPPPPCRDAAHFKKGDRQGILHGNRPPWLRHLCRPGEHHLWACDADRGRRNGRYGIIGPGCRLPAVDSDLSQKRCEKVSGHIQSGPVPGNGIQHLRVSVCPLGNGRSDH
jgi:hypothetical protein